MFNKNVLIGLSFKFFLIFLKFGNILILIWFKIEDLILLIKEFENNYIILPSKGLLKIKLYKISIFNFSDTKKIKSFIF